ncbi:Oidioi.mRNA.OKI2018_I69.PAR.g11159.t1.cds [Oikopleura dioica]|uniref:Oidioi.mRNA.OKI2018_I69.PAR.g11159.t1.cds n=1 Tax=Oikopleura dioica TaxID=34765 RepID=A0ABN7S0R1_OIKDI|nr:Oidioi.mRNA.OKI2018_I69.PAR.g11159.t1.cds [Oikopleura dioica]
MSFVDNEVLDDNTERDVFAVDLSEKTYAAIKCQKKLKIRACPNEICPEFIKRGEDEYLLKDLATIYDGTILSCGRKGIILRLGTWSRVSISKYITEK